MLLTTIPFFAFVTFIYFLIYLCNKRINNKKKQIEASNIILLISSLILIGYIDLRYAFIILCISLSTWFFAYCQKYTIGIIIALLTLGVFKYYNFFINSFASVFNTSVSTLNLLLPLGISFYTFSAISYLSDVRKNKISKKNLIEVSLYLSFFPKITSGPIIRPNAFFNQIEKPRNINKINLSHGIQIFLWGAFKKLVLADRLSVFVDQVYSTPRAFGSLTVFLATIAYCFQIYLDFSGYSNMAIGISKTLDIDLPQNFNLPYLSQNVSEFWKRWHITLSSWLQDYVYIPLGGNRKGKIRTYINLLITMLIGGLWHGAAWNFILWGGLHGIALILHKLWTKISNSPKKQHSKLYEAISTLLTFIFIDFTWVFFKADSFEQAALIIQRIFAFEHKLEQPFLWLFISIILSLGHYCICFYRSRKSSLQVKPNACNVQEHLPILTLSKFPQLVLFFIFLGLLICLAYTNGSPFIYGNF